MKRWKHFECCACHEPFTYDPPSSVQERMKEMELQIGRPVRVMVECPHCPAHLYLDLATGQVSSLSGENSARDDESGGVFWDMTLTESVKERVTDLNTEGDSLMRQGKAAAAQAKFEEAIGLRKHDPLSWYNLGVCRLQLGDVPGAQEAFRHATRHDEKFVNAWNNLGMLLLQQEQFGEAGACFEQGIAADPDYPKCYLGMANVCVFRGDVSGARRYCMLALEKDPQYDRARLFLEQLQRLGRRGR